MKTRLTGSTRKAIQIVATAGIALGAVPAAADQIFLQIANLPGESLDKAHKDWIEVLSYSQGVSAGRCSQISIQKSVDRSTPGLMELAAFQKPVASATLAVVNSEYGVEYLKVAMTGVIVNDHAYSGCDGCGRPSDYMSLTPSSMTISYRRQNPSTGAFDAPITKTLMCANYGSGGGSTPR
ncbi:MAG: type VI secretion system tube protein Hcp [Betaproteobacteria bacterium]|nr:type VI secretion system tube protein Hcp [Betaproteobacteria bacterium]